MSRGVAIVCIVFLIGCGFGGTPVQEISVRVDPAQQLDAFVPEPGDWTTWRGPNGNGTARSEPPPLTWSDHEHVLWKAPIPGRGHGSPVVRGNQVLLPTALESEQQQLVVAFDRDTGAEQWRTVVHNGSFPSPSEVHKKGTYANGTVACDDQHLFAAFLNGGSIVASALDFNGQIAWQTTLGAFDSRFGYAPSPVVYQSLVIFAADNQGGGYLAALHRRTGDVVWRIARAQLSSYSSPIVANVAGRDQLLISGANEVCSYHPETGELLWSCRGTAEATCGTMVWNDTTVFASGGYPDKQTLAVRADGSGKVLWSNSVKAYEPSMLLVGDELYSANDDGIAYCWDAQTGAMHWRQRLGGSFSASPVACDDIVFATNTSGTTFVFRASAEQYHPLSENQLGDDNYASPALCNGRIYMRVGTQANGLRQEMLFCLGE